MRALPGRQGRRSPAFFQMVRPRCHAGKLVGIANGQVVVVADCWREVSESLLQAEPDPTKCYCIEASKDYDEVEEIWNRVD
jgi:hypothetical protein